MDKTKKEIIILGLKVFFMAIILLLLPVWTFFYFLIGIPSVILAEFVENITGMYLMTEISMIFFIFIFYWLLLFVKNDNDNSDAGILFRNFQIIILSFLLFFPIIHNYVIDENFYVQYFTLLIPTVIILIVGNRKYIKRLLN